MRTHLCHADAVTFPSGNRNAASHRWASLLLDCASQLDGPTLVKLFAGFCPISGSITGGGDAQRHIYPSSGWGTLPAMSTSAAAAAGEAALASSTGVPSLPKAPVGASVHSRALLPRQ